MTAKTEQLGVDLKCVQFVAYVSVKIVNINVAANVFAAWIWESQSWTTYMQNDKELCKDELDVIALMYSFYTTTYNQSDCLTWAIIFRVCNKSLWTY